MELGSYGQNTRRSTINRFNPFKPNQWYQMVTLHSVQDHTGLTHTFLFFDIRALWRSGLSARVPEYQKIKGWIRPVSH